MLTHPLETWIMQREGGRPGRSLARRHVGKVRGRKWRGRLGPGRREEGRPPLRCCPSGPVLLRSLFSPLRSDLPPAMRNPDLLTHPHMPLPSAGVRCQQPAAHTGPVPQSSSSWHRAEGSRSQRVHPTDSLSWALQGAGEPDQTTSPLGPKMLLRSEITQSQMQASPTLSCAP